MSDFDTNRFLETFTIEEKNFPVSGLETNYHYKVIKKIDMNEPNK